MSLQTIADSDVVALQEAEKSYGDSWRKRGGVGAFMMLARKWDRIENQVKAQQYDVFHAIEADHKRTHATSLTPAITVAFFSFF